MDLQRLLSSWSQHLRAFPWNAQSVAILCLLVVAFSAVVLLQNPVDGNSQENLFAGQRLTHTELQRIEAALGKADLTDYTVSGGAILVPPQQRAKYFAVLQDADCFPRTFHSPTAQALQATSAFETSRTSQQRMHHAREQEARIMICKLTGIDDAFVVFDEKTDRSLNQNRTVTASVGVRTSEDHPLDPQTISVIQDMLLGFKVDLTRESITVTDLNRRISIRGSLDEPQSPQFLALTQQTLERTWKRKIQDAISFVPEATISVRIEPAEDPSVAKVVRASIGIPSTYLTRQGPRVATRQYDELASKTQSTIQQALKPILPDAQETELGELVSVNVFDVENQPQMSQPTRLFANVFTSLLVVACLLSGLFLFVAVGKPRDPDPEHQLRVYGADEVPQPSDKDEQEPEDQVAKLRAFVADDPDVAAKKLSDFIDRAS